jgi:hypothetical protein
MASFRLDALDNLLCRSFRQDLTTSYARALSTEELYSSSYMFYQAFISTYDHRSVKTGHPVRSAIHKH